MAEDREMERQARTAKLLGGTTPQHLFHYYRLAEHVIANDPQLAMRAINQAKADTEIMFPREKQNEQD